MKGPALQSASGRLAFEIEGSTCEGFTVSFRMATKYRPKEGEVTLIDTMTTTYEGPGALDFRHQMQGAGGWHAARRPPHQDDARPRRRRGEGDDLVQARRGPSPFPPDALLPMQHQLRLMALGEAGGGRDFERDLRRFGRGQVVPRHFLRRQGEAGRQPRAGCHQSRGRSR